MSSGLSQAEIDALLKGDSTPADPAPADPNAMMSQEDIEAMLAGAGDDAAPAVEIPADPNAVMTPEQIEALLNGSAAPAADPAPMLGEEMPLPQEAKSPMPALAPDELLTTVETDAMGEIGNISMGTAATTLFTLLSHKVDITTPTVDLTTMRRISEEYPLPFVAVEVQYTLGLEGTNILFLREHDVKIITDLLMGGDGTNLADELSELHLSAISEVMNQMVGSSSTSLAKLMGLSIDISPPRAYTVNMVSDASKVYANLDEVIVRTSFDMVVEGLINSQIMQVTPVDFAKRMVANLVGGGATAAAGMSDAKTAPAPAPAPAPKPAPPGYPPYPQQPQYAPPPGYPPYPQYAPQPAYQQPQHMVDVHAAQFGSFDAGSGDGGIMAENMDLLMDVPLTVSVELGKSSKHIKEILDFNIGTIVVLDKLAGELVDIVVNGKLIAKGEVVVIDDNYGTRITDIVSPSKRLGPQ